MHKNISILIAFFCSASLLFAAQENVIRSLQGPSTGVKPTVVHPLSLPYNSGPGNENVKAIPVGEYGEQEETIEQEKLPNGVKLGGTVNIDLNSGIEPFSPNQGTNFQGMLQNGWIPYDGALAVGPNHVVNMTNSQWAVYNKTTGAQMYITQFDPFFGNAAGGGFDPKCFYDATAGKYVLMVVETSNPKALIDIAVSQTSDPLGAWWKYSFDVTKDGNTQTSNWMDFPGLGYSDNAIYVGGDQYSFTNSYKYSKVRVFSKAQLYSGAAATYTDFVNLTNADGTSAFAPKPAQNITADASGYIINTRPGGGSSITLWRIDNAPTAPTLTRVATVAVGTFAVPPSGKQPGGSSVNTGDCRTQDVAMRNGILYTGITEKYGSTKTTQVSALRYWQITKAGVKNKDITYTAAGIFMCYPAVCADASGNMFMTYSRSSTTEYASMYRTGMLTTDATIQASSLVKSGAGTVTSGRWGDYSAIAPDPSNSAAVWDYAGWSQANGAWATWNAATSFGVPPKTLPSVAFANDRSFALTGNYPNPFNPSTMISFTLPEETQAKLVVYDILGNQVATLLDGVISKGEHEVEFSAAKLASGVYYYRLTADNGAFSQMKKMVLMK